MAKDITKDWTLYEAGKVYNQTIINQNEISYYDKIDLVYSFYDGNQWRGQEGKKLPKPVFNYIKRALTYFVASLTSTNTSIVFKSATGDKDEKIEILNTEIQRFLEKMKIENRIRDMLFDAGKTGDACLHFWFDPDKKTAQGLGEIQWEQVDGSNVMFGNANINCVQKQPYIIVVGREIANKLQKEATSAKVKVTADSENHYFPRR